LEKLHYEIISSPSFLLVKEIDRVYLSGRIHPPLLLPEITMKLPLVLALALLSASAHAERIPFNAPSFNGIIGGTDVAANDPIAQSTVLIVAEEDGSQSVCTGTIIEKDIVLTAAHCVGLSGLAQVVVVFRTSVQGEGPVIQVVERRRPTDFVDRAGSPTDWHDVAVLRLAEPIPAGYQPARMVATALIKDGATVTLAGYGMNVAVAPADPAPSGSGTLRKVEQTIITAKFGKTETLVSLAGGKGACKGDSGGPAYIKQNGQYFLFGVASRMTEKDRVASNGDEKDFACSVEMIYSNATVPALAVWIKKAIAQMRDNIPLNE
jgi:secreted trypsin-like serine protease